MDKLTALSVLDGRYAALTTDLADIFSEAGLIRNRVFVELQWLKFLGRDLCLFDLTAEDAEKITAIGLNFDARSAQAVKDIEKTTNHDVKAVEYYIKEQLDAVGLSAVREWTHFSCTSEDINNSAYALMIKQGRSVVAEELSGLLEKLEALAKTNKSLPMMSRTHGQPATPTTLGKEFVNFSWRFSRELDKLRSAEIHAKINGASGNFNAHLAAFPDVDWIRASERFVAEYLEAVPLLLTTQINPYHYISELLQVMMRIAAAMIDFDRDMWGYISLNYFSQKLKEGEVGSSTMPHKVNPIDFENSEGNLGVAISLMSHLSMKLLQSRFQRDLSDSTVLRNLGAVFGYMLIGIKNCVKGLGKINVNLPVIKADLDGNPALLAEPIQTVMRMFGEENPYEKLKDLTRGQAISADDFGRLIDSLEKVPDDYKSRLRSLTCDTYTGLAEQLVDAYFEVKPGD